MKFAKTTVACCALVSLPVYADNLQPASTLPSAAGTPHVCSEYPTGALLNGAQGETGIGFKVTADGAASDPHVTKSSGNDDLDQAAVACVAKWRYTPATQNGTPVGTDWRADVVWKIQEIPPSATESAHNCVVSPPTPAAHRDEARLMFWVAGTGKVRDIRVYQSSGDEAFDAALARCVSTWTYAPATRNGIPIDAQWGARFAWAQDTGVVSVDGFAPGHHCRNGWYQTQARSLDAERTTVLKFEITEGGAVKRLDIAETSGDSRLDRAAMQCVAQWKYKPALQNGRPIKVPWSAQVTWKQGHAFVAETGASTPPN